MSTTEKNRTLPEGSIERTTTKLNLGPTHPATHGVFQNILELDGERCGNIAVSLGALGARPIRARTAEQLLVGEIPGPDVLRDAERLVCEAAQPFEDTRGSVEYKRHLAGVLFRRAFDIAVDRARGVERATIYM